MPITAKNDQLQNLSREAATNCYKSMKKIETTALKLPGVQNKQARQELLEQFEKISIIGDITFGDLITKTKVPISNAQQKGYKYPKEDPEKDLQDKEGMLQNMSTTPKQHFEGMVDDIETLGAKGIEKEGVTFGNVDPALNRLMAMLNMWFNTALGFELNDDHQSPLRGDFKGGSGTSFFKLFEDDKTYERRNVHRTIVDVY